MSSNTKQAWATGGTIFAATAILIIGCFQVIMGISALAQDEIFVSTPSYTFDIDVTGWGWVHLILGVVMMATGVVLYTGAAWARGVGIALAVFSAIDNFFFIPYYPLWSIVVIALDVFAIWALATVTGPIMDKTPPKPAATTGGRTQTQDWSHVNEPTTRSTDRPEATQEHTAER